METPKDDIIAAVYRVIQERKANPSESSYTASLMRKGIDKILKKIGEEATEVVMAAKDADRGADRQRIVAEVADLWFHTMIALSYYGLSPADVVAELDRRAGTSGIEEKALRKAKAREGEA
jgi:phosphoribosyl-ATP pyrophosphohydrolase